MDYQLQASKFHKEAKFTSSGIIAPINGHKLYGEARLHVGVLNVNKKNAIIVEGKLIGDTTWIEIAEVTGSGHFPDVNIGRYDLIRFRVLRYAAVPGEIPQMIASGYFNEVNGNTDVIDTLAKTNQLLLDTLCVQEKIYRKMELLLLHIETITDEDINGDL